MQNILNLKLAEQILKAWQEKPRSRRVMEVARLYDHLRNSGVPLTRNDLSQFLKELEKEKIGVLEGSKFKWFYTMRSVARAILSNTPGILQTFPGLRIGMVGHTTQRKLTTLVLNHEGCIITVQPRQGQKLVDIMPLLERIYE